jgi:hypothetical protein
MKVRKYRWNRLCAFGWGEKSCFAEGGTEEFNTVGEKNFWVSCIDWLDISAWSKAGGKGITDFKVGKE